MEKSIGGVVSQNKYGSFVLVEKKFDLDYRHGKVRLASCLEHENNVLTRLCFSKSSACETSTCSPSFDLKKTAFIDCETTGLAGGVGTYAFLVGIGYFSAGSKGQDSEFIISQYFMRDFDEEPAILLAVSEKLNNFQSMASYNGKCYDLPLLENRSIVNRIDFDSTAWSHLDLLFSSRRLWKRRIQDCSLANVEQKILNVEREIDIPSYLIPQIYFDYLRSGIIDPLIPVFHHNMYDILSLVSLLVLISQAIQDFVVAGIEDPIDLYSLGIFHYSLGNYPKSIACFEQALSKDMPTEWRQAIYINLAYVYKRTGGMKQAASIWHHLLKEEFPFNFYVYEELAKYYEHKEKDYPQALLIVDKVVESLNMNTCFSSNFNYGKVLESLKYRRSRLERKKAYASSITNEQLKN
ncbi:MAG: ribonuclease H-like domain-containing protein [candidate division Zixibacteria bacterium]|nr:ribonuclease H-like domain-containing protein [candidate division Zixibacteria bacterium]